MITLPRFFLPLALLCCAFLAPRPVLAFNAEPAQPVKAVFYPNEVELSVQEKATALALPSGAKGFLICLPAAVQRNTLAVSVNGQPASGLFWVEDKDERYDILSRHSQTPAPSNASLPENEKSPERRALLEKLVALEAEQAVLTGALSALDQRQDLWNKSLERFASGPIANRSGVTLSTAEEASELNALIGRQLLELSVERQKLTRRMEDLRPRHQRAYTELREFDLRSNVALAVLPYEGAGELAYSYTLPAESHMAYRLNAEPDKKELAVTQEAVLLQNSGLAWTEAEIFISTLRRDRTIKPRTIRPWRIEFASAVLPAPAAPQARPAPKAMAMELRTAAGGPEADMMDAAEAPGQNVLFAQRTQPVESEKATYRLWSLGKRRIEHKTPVRLALAASTLPAEFVYVVRPQSNPRGFLTARLDLDKPLELSPGLAQFSVDGASIGQQVFSFNGSKGQVFFGSDPQVTATVRDLKQSGGQQGFFSKDDTLLWHWEITVKNARAKAVDVLLEDPRPDAGDESISIKAASRPNPEELVNGAEDGGAKIYRWSAQIQPGDSFVVNHKVEVSAPSQKDRVLSPGR